MTGSWEAVLTAGAGLGRPLSSHASSKCISASEGGLLWRRQCRSSQQVPRVMSQCSSLTATILARCICGHWGHAQTSKPSGAGLIAEKLSCGLEESPSCGSVEGLGPPGVMWHGSTQNQAFTLGVVGASQSETVAASTARARAFTCYVHG